METGLTLDQCAKTFGDATKTGLTLDQLGKALGDAGKRMQAAVITDVEGTNGRWYMGDHATCCASCGWSWSNDLSPACAYHPRRKKALKVNGTDTVLPMRINAEKTVAVSNEVFWNEDMSICPRGVKVQLLGQGGVATYGTYDGKDQFWVKWQSVPRNRRKE